MSELSIGEIIDLSVKTFLDITTIPMAKIETRTDGTGPCGFVNVGAVVVDAFKLGADYIPDWFADKITDNTVTLHGTSTGFYDGHDTNADINTLEVVMHANYGDYIIRGISGELYPCKPDIFAATYEPVGGAQ